MPYFQSFKVVMILKWWDFYIITLDEKKYNEKDTVPI